jgi:hypothetical protein
MILRLLALAIVLAVLGWGLRWLATAPPERVARLLRLIGLGGLVLLGAWLVLTGKEVGIAAVVAGLAPWIGRALRLHALWRALGRMWTGMQGGGSTPGQASTIATRFLRMTLDHGSGRLDGEVLDGRFRGSRLSDFDEAGARLLWRDVQADPQSVQVLEAWLDRTWPDWRRGAEQAEGAAAEGGNGAMTRAEAWEILGLAPNAADDDIRAAHRRLMLLAHPDHGGSTWIAARLNQARDLLLGGG